MKNVKLKDINEYKSQSINPSQTPDTVYEVYSVPSHADNKPEYLQGNEIGSNKAVVIEGDVLLCKINPRINRVWVVGNPSEYMSVASSEWIVIRNKAHNPEYLAWYFRSDKFKTLMNSGLTGIGGSLTRAQPKQVATYPVPIRDRKEQDEIVSVLNKVDRIINCKREQLEELNTLIKSRFVEMFGDIFNGKSNYPTVKISDVVVSKIGRAKMYFNGDDEIKYVDISSVDNKKNIIDGYTEYLMKDAPSRAQQHVRKDDIIISTVRPNLNNVAKVQHDYLNIVASSGFCVLRASKVESNFLFALVSMKSFADYLASLTTGANYPAVSDKDILNFEIPNAPIEEQIKFSDLIEQVEKLKVGIQKSLNETQILFNSLMQEYFG